MIAAIHPSTRHMLPAPIPRCASRHSRGGQLGVLGVLGVARPWGFRGL
jgi:hypothetical protein